MDAPPLACDDANLGARVAIVAEPEIDFSVLTVEWQTVPNGPNGVGQGWDPHVSEDGTSMYWSGAQACSGDTTELHEAEIYVCG